MLNQIKIPRLDPSKIDEVKWVSNQENIVKFSVNRAWKDMCDQEEKMEWNKVVWFSNMIPRHAFILWLLIHEKLPTRDRIIRWYPNKSMSCSLCGEVNDSHEHLFFKCKYSKEVWKRARQDCKIHCLIDSWKKVLEELILMPNKQSIWIIVKKIVFATNVYFLWQERNLRLFQNCKRDWDTIWKAIQDNVKLKLSSLKVLKTAKFREVFDIWGIVD